MGHCEVLSASGWSNCLSIRLGQHDCRALLDTGSLQSFINPTVLTYTDTMLRYADTALIEVGIGGQIIYHWSRIGGPPIPVVLGLPFFRELAERFPTSMVTLDDSEVAVIQVRGPVA